MTSTQPPAAPTAARRRLMLVALVVVLAGLDLAVKAWAERQLAGDRGVELGVVDLRLAFNPGVAFSLGDALPPAVLLAVTGSMIIALAVAVWWTSRTGGAVPVALAVVLAGAVGNFLDRAVDGMVTDYLHTGWFPTFNGADVLITVGAAVLVLASLWPQRRPPEDSAEEAGG